MEIVLGWHASTYLCTMLKLLEMCPIITWVMGSFMIRILNLRAMVP